MKFIADANVGRLAKRLRLAGFDTVFENNIEDSRLVRMAVGENRVLLTKDTEIAKRRLATSGRLRVLLVEGDDVRSQLLQVLRALHLNGEVQPFTRCIECNACLQGVEKADVAGAVPPYVYKTHSDYRRCPCCGRVYWRGTHWQRMRNDLDEVMAAL